MENVNEKNFQVIKLILFIITIIILILLSIKLFPLFINLGTIEGQSEFKKQIENSGLGGIFTLLGLQILQILLPILPGEPIEFLAGMCFGTVYGMILIFIGAFLSSFIIFYCVRKFGKAFIYSFLGEDKFENNKWFSNTANIEMFFVIAFLIPGTPKDLFVYAAGLLPIKPLRFLLISTFCRFPSIISSTFAGSNLVSGNWNLSIICYIITFVISITAVYIHKQIYFKEDITKN